MATVHIKLIEPIFATDCKEYVFDRVEMRSDNSHIEIRDLKSYRLIFKCPISNIDSFVDYERKITFEEAVEKMKRF